MNNLFKLCAKLIFEGGTSTMVTIFFDEDDFNNDKFIAADITKKDALRAFRDQVEEQYKDSILDKNGVRYIVLDGMIVNMNKVGAMKITLFEQGEYAGHGEEWEGFK